MTLRFAILFGGLLLLLPHGQAQDRSKGPPSKVVPAPDPKEQRSVYAVRGGDPAALAQVVTKHFRGKVTVSVMPDVLVLSGEPDDLQEVTMLLTRIDRPARTVEIEVTLIEVTTKGDAPAMTLPPAADLLARADELSKGGAAVQRIKLTAVEGQQVSVQTGGNKPYTTSSAVRGPFGGGGPGGNPGLGGGDRAMMQRSVSYHAVGTTVKATTRVEADNSVAVALDVQDSTVKAAEAGDDAAGGAPTFDTASLATSLSVPVGKPVMAQAIRKDAKASRTTTLVIVTAKVVAPAK
jgi:hypothetical protein